jgi:hypothetical protein
VREVTEQASTGKKSLLGRGGGNAKAVEELHATLRDREVELEHQERRLAELASALQRREADLNTMARRLQSDAGPPTDSFAGDMDEKLPKRDDLDQTQKRLQFWSR